MLIKNIKTLVQVRDASHPKMLKGEAMRDLPTIDNAFLLIENERIIDFGTMDNCPTHGGEIIDATGRMVFPTWCDSHTHLVFAGSREQEFVDRINGLTYEEITERGGGIHNSAKRLQHATEEELYESAMTRLREIRAFGTGAVEIKSGYGLTTESELKMLRVAKRIKQNTKMPVKLTFLGAHAIPLTYKDNRQAYIDLIINEMLPIVVEEGLADYCDVFCEKGFFTMEETDEILKAAAKYGMKSKIHANELYLSGGVQVGVANNSISVDHLECMSDDEIEALKDSVTMPTILPSTAFFLSMEYAPARKMIDAGLPVALASDYNPGSTPSGRMSFVLSLACLKMKMTPEEAINAATINGAYAMELSEEVGSITKGKLGNVFISKPIPSIAFLPYAFGSDLVETVILRGEVV
ncbi:MAG: imidazolonepropionase [Saprospiraceae bacterium]